MSEPKPELMTELKDLATGVLTETLHGAVPMETVSKLAQGVLDLQDEIYRFRLHSRCLEPDCVSNALNEFNLLTDKLEAQLAEEREKLKRAEPILRAAKTPDELTRDYDHTWDTFWKDLVCDENGELDLDKVKRELHDYGVCIDQVGKVYDHVTGGLLTKPNTAAEHVIGAFDESVDDHYQEELDYLRQDIQNLEQWVDDLQSGMFINCVYCGHRYGPRDEVPTSMAQVLKEHVEQCPKHPMSKLKEKADRGCHSGCLDSEGEITSHHPDCMKQKYIQLKDRTINCDTCGEPIRINDDGACWGCGKILK